MRTRFGLVAGILAALSMALPATAGEGEPAKKGEAKPPLPSNSVETKPRRPGTQTGWERIPLPPAALKGVKWLVISQNDDGGWGMNGVGRQAGSAPRHGEDGSDIGNTSMAALAILATQSTPSRGTFQGPLERAVEFVLDNVEVMLRRRADRPPTRSGRQPPGQSQLESKIGRSAPMFLSARLLTAVDGKMHTDKQNKRVRRTLEKLVGKIVSTQSSEGSWNTAGGWAPIHSTSYASKTLWAAKALGIDVDDRVFQRVNDYTARAISGNSGRKSGGTPPSKRRKGPGRSPPVTTPGSGSSASGPVTSGSAGVHLYSIGQAIEQLTRTPEDRKQYTKLIRDMARKAASEATLKGLGTMGGEEFISYHNINLAMARIGGRQALYWNVKMKKRLAELQNGDGSWSGHHCITGRTACTGAAIMTLVAERSVSRTR